MHFSGGVPGYRNQWPERKKDGRSYSWTVAGTAVRTQCSVVFARQAVASSQLGVQFHSTSLEHFRRDAALPPEAELLSKGGFWQLSAC